MSAGTHASVRVAGFVCSSTLITSAPRSAKWRPAMGPAQFAVTSMKRSPASGPSPVVAAASGGGGAASVSAFAQAKSGASTASVCSPRAGADAAGARSPSASLSFQGRPGASRSRPPSRSLPNQSRAASCWLAATSAIVFTGVTAIRSSCAAW